MNKKHLLLVFVLCLIGGLFCACHKEEEIKEPTDYRDKWVGEYEYQHFLFNIPLNKNILDTTFNYTKPLIVKKGERNSYLEIIVYEKDIVNNEESIIYSFAVDSFGTIQSGRIVNHQNLNPINGHFNHYGEFYFQYYDNALNLKRTYKGKKIKHS